MVPLRTSTIGWLLGGVLLATPANGARREKTRGAVEEPAPWEQPGGRERARLEFAEALLGSGSPDACLEVIAQLRQDGVHGLELERLHARALSATGLSDDARVILQQAAKKWPRDAGLHNALGILAMDADDVTAAVQHFERAVHFDRDNSDHLNNLGFALLVAQRHGEAIEVLRTALRADSSRAQTRNNLGFALVAAGREDEAWRVFKAASRSPADAHYHVGVGLERRGDVDSASTAYRRALDADPEHTPARAALTRLSEPDAPPSPLPNRSEP